MWCTLSCLVYHLGKCCRRMSFLESSSSLVILCLKHSNSRTGFFTGVKSIWHCNTPFGYIYFPAKESAQLQIKRLVNTHNTVSLILLGGTPETAQLAPGACQSSLLFLLLCHKGQPHNFCWKQFQYLPAILQSLSRVWAGESLGRTSLPHRFSSIFNTSLLHSENSYHFPRSQLGMSVLSTLRTECATCT